MTPRRWTRDQLEQEAGPDAKVKLWWVDKMPGVTLSLIRCQLCNKRWTSQKDADVHGTGGRPANVLNQWLIHVAVQHSDRMIHIPWSRALPHLKGPDHEAYWVWEREWLERSPEA